MFSDLDDTNMKFMTSNASILAFAYDSLANSAPATRSCRQPNTSSSTLAKAGSRDKHGKLVQISRPVAQSVCFDVGSGRN